MQFYSKRTPITNIIFSGCMKESNQSNIILLNTLTGWIDKVTSIIVHFIIKPITLVFLGANLFGVLEMLHKMTEFMASADFRSATTVKWILSVEREKSSTDILNSKISAGFFASIITIPIYLLIGSVIIYMSPYITKVHENLYLEVRTCASVLVISFIITQVFFLYEQILQGMNMAYKRIGIRAFITILGGLLTYLFLFLGMGLTGVVLSNLAVVVLTGVSYWFVVRENLKWVRIVKVRFEEIFGFVKLSIGFMFEKLISVFSRSLDVLILGYFITTEVVSQYSITSYLFISLSGFILMFMSSYITSISPLAKSDDKHSLLKARAEMWFLQILIYSYFFVLVVLFNRSFVGLWSGQQMYVGWLCNLLIIIYIICRCVADIERSFLCMYLKLKEANLNALFSLVFLCILSIPLIKAFALPGLLLSLVLSQMLMVILNVRSFKKIVNKNLNTLRYLDFRFVITITVMIILASFLGEFLNVDSWLVFIGIGVITSLLVAAIYYYVALKSLNKSIINKYIRFISVRRKKTNSVY